MNFTPNYSKNKLNYWIIYIIESADRFYIGSTSTNLEYRIQKHKKETRYNIVRYNWLQTDEVVYQEIVRASSKEEALQLENKWMRHYMKEYQGTKTILNIANVFNKDHKYNYQFKKLVKLYGTRDETELLKCINSKLEIPYFYIGNYIEDIMSKKIKSIF